MKLTYDPPGASLPSTLLIWAFVFFAGDTIGGRVLAASRLPLARALPGANESGRGVLHRACRGTVVRADGRLR